MMRTPSQTDGTIGFEEEVGIISSGKEKFHEISSFRAYLDPTLCVCGCMCVTAILDAAIHCARHPLLMRLCGLFIPGHCRLPACVLDVWSTYVPGVIMTTEHHFTFTAWV